MAEGLRTDTNPSELQATPTETRSVKAGSCASGEKLAALHQDLSGPWSQDRDVVDRVPGADHQGREGIHVGETDTLGV